MGTLEEHKKYYRNYVKEKIRDKKPLTIEATSIEEFNKLKLELASNKFVSDGNVNIGSMKFDRIGIAKLYSQTWKPIV